MEGVKMKKILLVIMLMIGSAVIFGGCEDKDYIVGPDHTPPSVPKGFYSITGNEVISLRWEENDEKDFSEYRIYRMKENETYYKRIAKTKTAKFDDYDVKNGVTYYYAVSAVDYSGNESDLSKEIYDTPRLDGSDRLYDRFYEPSLSGYDFSESEVLHWLDPETDIYLEYDDNLETFFLCVADTFTDIQDFGYTDNLTDVNWSPFEGWSKVGWVEVILGHSYIVWTWDDHYATLRVEKITGDTRISFDWAYQTDQGNPELTPRPPHAENYLRVATREVSAK
jgi:hypothetical protein